MSTNIHFVGIGGIGMSALARYFLANEYSVSGSDMTNSSLLSELEAEGIRIFHEHCPENFDERTEKLIYSEAVPEVNPERKKAKAMGIPQKSYFAALGEISKTKKTVAICGTHGKSTTTGMAGLALEAAGADPLIILGTKVFEWEQKNIRLPESQESDLFVVESCEYHHSFLHLSPSIILVTNVEPDHLDFFGTKERYFAAFQKFSMKLTSDQSIIADFSDPFLQELFSDCQGQKINTSDFLSEVPDLFLPGKHNRENASKVLALFSILGIPLVDGKKALQNFRGTWRRFEYKGEKDGLLFFDDYAHHPTEIRATLSALREKFPERKIWAIFQPHQYSRTREFLEEFGESFSKADEVLIPNIFRVRDTDKDVASVSPEDLVQKIKSHGVSVRHSQDFEKTVEILKSETKTGDVIISIGAGPVYKVTETWFTK